MKLRFFSDLTTRESKVLTATCAGAGATIGLTLGGFSWGLLYFSDTIPLWAYSLLLVASIFTGAVIAAKIGASCTTEEEMESQSIISTPTPY